ncbi:protein kinase-like protein Scy1p [[Candida] jaroonii]|uniref:Protein kinase-like protein Scy1p n=1 Tax=[Candida] jaroonii TaxID=467808 RepID=A0ACA9YAY6_9ASCO|nr:protein kinase-like protein Scy1p [[Candida] jaroonii]
MFKSVFKSGIRAAYDVSNNPTFVSEPWYVYPAKNYATGKQASVFIFDKSKFEASIQKLCSNISNTKNPRVIISECYELIKYEVSQLAKLKHPQLLTVYEVLEETKSKFLFVTEPIVNNLLTVNIEKLDELSLQKGLLEICKGIQFLHNYCSIIHLNLQPSSIFINQQGDWKLAGFKFLQNLNEMSNQDRDNFYIMNNSSIVPFANLNLNFTPPELIVDNHSRLEFGNDIWSLGCLIYYLYNGDYLINCFDANSISDYKSEFRKFETKFYNHKLGDLKYVLKQVPDQLFQLFPLIMARYPNDRINIDKIIDSEFFNGSLIKAMFFVDEFSTKSIDEKLIFLSGLLEVREDGKMFIDNFPSNFKNIKLLPLLIELLKSELNVGISKDEVGQATRIDLVSNVLTIILNIGSKVSHLTFQDKIFNSIFKVDSSLRKKQRVDYFDKMMNFSVKVRLAYIENLEILVEKVNDKDVADMIKKSCSLILTLPSNEQHYKQEQAKLQDLFLNKTDLFVKKFDFPYIKNTFFPLIIQVFKTTTILSTKLSTIKVFENMVDEDIIDKTIVKEQLLPIFQNLKSRDKRIVGNVLKFFSKLSKDDKISLDLETIVEFILPICLKLVFGCNDCVQSEFKSYMATINEIQSNLVKQKLPSLPTKQPEKRIETPSNNFDSLISTQAINSGNLEHTQTAPASEVLRPTRPTTSAPIKSNSHDILQPKKQIKPLSLKPKETKPTPLTFGSTGTNQNTETKNLFKNLEGTFNDEFSDFQSATPTPPINKSVQTFSQPIQPTNIQSNYIQPTNNLSTNNQPVQPSPMNFSTMSPLVPKQPPGFSNSILMPSSKSTPPPKNNDLDFL